jgi:hypothetical protein
MVEPIIEPLSYFRDGGNWINRYRIADFAF